MSAEDKEFAKKVAALAAWKRLLESSHELAAAKARAAVRAVSERGVFATTEIARFYSQMMNGVATPEDFAPGGRA